MFAVRVVMNWVRDDILCAGESIRCPWLAAAGTTG